MTPPVKMTTMIILPVIGAEKRIEVPANYNQARKTITETIGEGPEHVAVLYDGARRDMFVGEDSANGTKVRNMRATEIYRNNTLTREPGTDPESLPACYGIAVLFPDEIVWR